jgi:hypothetical protein
MGGRVPIEASALASLRDLPGIERCLFERWLHATRVDPPALGGARLTDAEVSLKLTSPPRGRVDIAYSFACPGFHVVLAIHAVRTRANRRTCAKSPKYAGTCRKFTKSRLFDNLTSIKISKIWKFQGSEIRGFTPLMRPRDTCLPGGRQASPWPMAWGHDRLLHSADKLAWQQNAGRLPRQRVVRPTGIDLLWQTWERIEMATRYSSHAPIWPHGPVRATFRRREG